jgi:hypothetical protein
VGFLWLDSVILGFMKKARVIYITKLFNKIKTWIIDFIIMEDSRDLIIIGVLLLFMLLIIILK